MALARTYLDHNASAPLRPEARDAMVDVLSRYGNASSVHGEGRDMRRLIEKARLQVAGLVNCDPEGVVFTASATEAAHLALTPDIWADGITRPAGHLYVLASEHSCVLAGGRFERDQTTIIPVMENGLIDEAAFDELLAGHDTSTGRPYVAIQLVNSETGIIQPVAKIANKVRVRGGYTLCDGVQAAGRLPVDTKELGADFLLLSAHKFGGPQGAAALINVHTILGIPAAIRGGGQEKKRRAGTENVAGIAGFGVAAELAAVDAQDYSRITALRDSIEGRLVPICTANGMADRFKLFGSDVERVGNTCLFSIVGMKAETALIAFDLEGVAVSSGSACSSGKVGVSHVLQAMQVPAELASGAIRISLGWNSTQDDVEKFIASFGRIVGRMVRQNETKISGAA